MKIKISIFFSCVIGIILTIYFTNLYLSLYFYANGEAFSKGFGHLLRENLLKGIFYISTLNLFLTIFITILFLNFFNQNYTTVASKILLYIALTILILLFTYLFFERNNIADGYIDKERIIEIILMWLCRVIGVLTGCFIIKNLSKLLLANTF